MPGGVESWKNGSVSVATSSPVSVPKTPGICERLRDVDRPDDRVRVGRANVVGVAHVVALDVVDEDALALDEAAVFLARDALSGPALLLRRRLDLDLLGCDDGLVDDGLAHSATSWPDAALTASKMFQ